MNLELFLISFTVKFILSRVISSFDVLYLFSRFYINLHPIKEAIPTDISVKFFI